MISSVLQRFAIDPVIHITPLTIFTIKGFAITNSMFYGVICTLLILIVMITVAKRMTLKPRGGITQVIEVGTDFITDLLKSSQIQ